MVLVGNAATLSQSEYDLYKKIHIRVCNILKIQLSDVSINIVPKRFARLPKILFMLAATAELCLRIEDPSCESSCL